MLCDNGGSDDIHMEPLCAAALLDEYIKVDNNVETCGNQILAEVTERQTGGVSEEEEDEENSPDSGPLPLLVDVLGGLAVTCCLECVEIDGKELLSDVAALESKLLRVRGLWQLQITNFKRLSGCFIKLTCASSFVCVQLLHITLYRMCHENGPSKYFGDDWRHCESFSQQGS